MQPQDVFRALCDEALNQGGAPVGVSLEDVANARASLKSGRITVIIWQGNPASGGTGYHGTGPGPLEAFLDAKREREIPSYVFNYMHRASSIVLPVVRLGDAEWSVEVRRG